LPEFLCLVQNLVRGFLFHYAGYTTICNESEKMVKVDDLFPFHSPLTPHYYQYNDIRHKSGNLNNLFIQQSFFKTKFKPTFAGQPLNPFHAHPYF